jgi:hypothetical protein
VRPLVEVVSKLIGYWFDDSDWSAIAHAPPDTDDDKADGWYSYPLEGRLAVGVQLARAVGGDEVSVKVTSPPDQALHGACALLCRVFADL